MTPFFFGGTVWTVLKTLHLPICVSYRRLRTPNIGYLDSAFFVGAFSASIIWTRLSDRWGRRPIIILGLSGALFLSLAFGLSVNFPMAMTVRFLWGALDGNIGVVKTLIGDLAKSGNQAYAYSILGALGGMGRLTGAPLSPLTNTPTDPSFSPPKNRESRRRMALQFKYIRSFRFFQEISIFFSMYGC